LHVEYVSVAWGGVGWLWRGGARPMCALVVLLGEGVVVTLVMDHVNVVSEEGTRQKRAALLHSDA